MSANTINTTDIPIYLEDKHVSIGETLYTSPTPGGGCKQLLFEGEPLSIIVNGTVYSMKYQIKDKLTMKISTETHDCIDILTNKIFDDLGYTITDNRTLSYEWNTDFWMRARISGNRDTVFTKFYEQDGDEVLISDVPSSFKGCASILIKGIYFTNSNPRKGKQYFIIEYEEIVIQETLKDVGRNGSKLLEILKST